MTPSIGALIAAGVLVACGGNKTDGDADGAAGGAQGGSNTMSGGSSVGGAGSESGASAQPRAQGAILFSVKPATPPPAGKSCPTSALTADIPEILSSSPAEALSERSYIHQVVDGDDGVSFDCRVASDNGWVVEADISRSGRGLRIESGRLGDDKVGTGTITLIDAQRFPALTSSAPCTLTAMQSNNNNLQIRAGSVWGKFVCAAVESPPTDSCAADGIFVLENCDQE